MTPHSSTFAWKIPWTEEPGRLQSMGSLESYTTERLHFSLSCIGEGNGNPLQCSCLENPRDGGAWWAAVYAVAQSRTRLKRLNSNRHFHIQLFDSLLIRKQKENYVYIPSLQRSPVRKSLKYFLFLLLGNWHSLIFFLNYMFLRKLLIITSKLIQRMNFVS